MFLPWLVGGAIVGSLLGLFVPRFAKFWNGLSDQTKKEIIETITKTFEITFRAYYKWWKSR
jgi:hypothetical protein